MNIFKKLVQIFESDETTCRRAMKNFTFPEFNSEFLLSGNKAKAKLDSSMIVFKAVSHGCDWLGGSTYYHYIEPLAVFKTKNGNYVTWRKTDHGEYMQSITAPDLHQLIGNLREGAAKGDVAIYQDMDAKELLVDVPEM